MARCQKPYYKEGVPCPCGKCEPCRTRHASGWSFRITKEAEQLGSAFFITLTYNPENVPMRYETKKDTKHTGYINTKRPTVDIYHLQKFMKRLKKGNLGKTIKYYGVSEYGTQTKRPHYHIIVMGMDIISFLGIENWKQVELGKIQLDGKTPLNVKSWKLGHITVGQVTPASVSYTLKYVSKGRLIPEYNGDDRQKEKSIMSKGIGLCYIDETTKKMHNNDLLRQYLVTNDSKKIAIPRYLKDRLYDHLERQIVSDIYANEELLKRLKMGEHELLIHEKKIRQQPPNKTTKNSKGNKGIL